MNIEYSLVLPPLPTSSIAALKDQYAALHRKLGRRLVLRENLNSLFPLDMGQLTFGHAGIVFVPKSLCLNGRYLSTVDSTGHDLVQDNQILLDYLMARDDVILFGGLVKHLINPTEHHDYGDIDCVATSDAVLDELAREFGYTFRAISSADSYPRYFLGQPC